MVYALGGVSAMSALSVAITLSESIGMSIDGGYSGASALIGSVLVGERDVDSLRELPRDMIRVTGPVFASAYALLFIFAKPLAVLFGAESGDVALFVTAIRLYNLWFFTDVIKCSAACLYRALGQVKEVCIYMALQNLAFPALVCWLGKHIGLWFVLCHQWIAEGLLILVFIGIYAVHAGHLPRSIFRITWVPSSLAVPAADRYSTSIRSREDVSRASEELNAFCLRRGLPSRTAYFAALCVEELAADTVQHGFSQCKKAGIIDLRVFHEDGKLSLLLRDNCPPFDPSEWLKLCAPDEPERSVGIRLVSRCAEEMEYAAAIGLNVVKIRL